MAKPKMISPRAYAARHNVPYSTVMSWLRAKLLRGAVVHTKPLVWYEVPENAAPPNLSAGRPSKKKSTKK
jgi:hypothetical protein